MASHTRKGLYGGSFENRSRLLLRIVSEVKLACGPSFLVGSRFNAFDSHPYPYGFGCDHEDMMTFDPTEPVALVKALRKSGIDILSCSLGNPYYTHSFVTRPYDQADDGSPPPPEHPLESVARMFSIVKEIQKAAGPVPVIGSGYSWLRQFGPHAGAANIHKGSCQFIGFGRSAFAYPDAAYDLRTKGEMDPRKCCITCGKCTQIMRDHGRTGCVIKDSKVYLPLYRQYRKEAIERAQRTED